MNNNCRLYDLIDGWDSYVADIENNLKGDKETWEDYLENPAPYLYDVLLDFGNFGIPYTDPNCAQRVHDIAIKALAQAGYNVSGIRPFTENKT